MSWADSNIFIPLQCTLDGKKLPGFLVDHHYAHSCSSAAKSQFDDNTLIFSADGSGASNLGNLASVLINGRLYPFLHTNFRGGQFYEEAAATLDLDCGKFMGLAGYGRHSTSLINSIPNDVLLKVNTGSIIASLPNFKMIASSQKDLLSKNNVDFAALCQSVFELQYLHVVNQLILTATKSLEMISRI